MMENDVDVALWQQGVLPEGEGEEIGPACALFEASVAVFSAILQVLASDKVHVDLYFYSSLRDEFRRFYMWNEGFSTRNGDLDHILAGSKNLKATVLGLMAQWARSMSKVPALMPALDWSSILAEVAHLTVLIDQVDQIARSAASDMKSQCFTLTALDNEGDLDLDSEADLDRGSDMSDYALEDIIEDFKIFMESLNDISPSLDHPATDHLLVEGLTSSLSDEILAVSVPARPFVLMIRDRFPSLDASIVKRLGEANWQRRERLRIRLASAPEIGAQSSASEDNRTSVGGTILPDHQTIISTDPSNISHAITFQSVTIESQFSDPSIFDSMSVSIRAARRFRPPESVTSFATSVAEGPSQGQRRVPSLPADHEYGTSIQCKICGDLLTEIQHRADWKKHVYNDLEPYICLFSDCELGLHTFQSRREWKNHEFKVHRVNAEWHCNLCQEKCETRELFRGHITDVHGNDVASSQLEEFISISKRITAGKMKKELCPFCLTTPSQTEAGFASHVGKHQREISLAALPTFDDYSDYEESVEGEENSCYDGDDIDDTDDNGEHNFKQEESHDLNTEAQRGRTVLRTASNASRRSPPPYSARKISFTDQPRPPPLKRRLRIPTRTASLASGFPYDPKLATYNISEAAWKTFSDQVVEAAELPRGASFLWPVVKGDVINKIRKELQYTGDFKRLLNAWNRKNFRVRGFTVSMELPGPPWTDYVDTEKEKERAKKEAKKFRICITPISSDLRRTASTTAIYSPSLKSNSDLDISGAGVSSQNVVSPPTYRRPSIAEILGRRLSRSSQASGTTNSPSSSYHLSAA